MKTEKKVKVLVAESCPTLQSHGEAHQGPLLGRVWENDFLMVVTIHLGLKM